MEIFIKSFFVLFVMLVLYITFRLIKWIYNNKTLRVLSISLIALFIVAKIINNHFFKKMEFIQSEVYPHLYLIKNPVKDKALLKKAIKEMVVEKMNAEFIGNEEKYKRRYHYANKSETELNYGFSFMEYYKGWGFNPIGEAGTAHFIKNKEDPGGFSSEYLEYYRERFQIGGMRVNYCKNDTINYTAVLYYSENGYVVERDTLINQCK